MAANQNIGQLLLLWEYSEWKYVQMHFDAKYLISRRRVFDI